MRVIAGTTLVFLPATFVAVGTLVTPILFVANRLQTLFSSDFFNFQPATGLISHWLWLYFAITGALTLAVLWAWRVLSRAREKQTEEILRPKPDVVDAPQSVHESQPGNRAASGFSLDILNGRLARRKKTPTMELEANEK